MKTEYDSKEEMFDFEMVICWKHLRLWKNEALNLFYSAAGLYEFETKKSAEIFSPIKSLHEHFSEDIATRCYFNYRTQRMLWAYGFENILKGIIMARIKVKDDSVTKMPIEQIKSHSLLKLSTKAEERLSEPETFYLGILEKCSVWAGRYPLPLSANGMYQSRKAMRSSEELSLRTSQRIQDYHDGKIPRIFCESDVIRGGIGYEEYETYTALKARLITTFDTINPED